MLSLQKKIFTPLKMTSGQARTKPAELRGRKNKLSSLQPIAYSACSTSAVFRGGDVLQQGKTETFLKKKLAKYCVLELL